MKVLSTGQAWCTEATEQTYRHSVSDTAVVSGADAVMDRIGTAIATAQSGDRAAARRLLTAIWSDVGSGGDPFHRCALAHAMADVQDDPAEELRWDLHALEAAELLTDERVAAGGVATTAAGFAPSLHLNLADVYRRLAEPERAAEHVARGRSALLHLPADGYRDMIETALARVERRLAEA